jgi:hypothetical protein
MKKIGRNDPCPFGSGRKYKKCCLDKNSMEQKTMPKEALIALKKHSEKHEYLKRIGIYINYVTPLVFKGKKFWAIGSRLYYNRPPNETFHEFIIDILRITLEKEWWEENIQATEKHFIVESFLKYCEWQKNTTLDSNKISEETWGAIPNGWSRSLLSLAFDVATLQHIQKFPEGLLKRLKNKDQYQGARYEIAIAAIFARLDCEIHFLDDQEKSARHCEFIATHRPSTTEIAVESKSRHRPGVIHMPGTSEEENLLKGDVGRLLKEALDQNPGDRPFIIF